MYTHLIDTVKSIVEKYGTGIITDSKFWNIMADSYSFGADHSLRKTFRECISKGYYSNISNQKSKKSTLAYLSSVIQTEESNIASSDTEWCACLFSVAIAIGKCNFSDYANFIKDKSSEKISKNTHKFNIKDLFSFNKSFFNGKGWPTLSIKDVFFGISMILLSILALSTILLEHGAYLHFFKSGELFFELGIAFILQIGTCYLFNKYINNCNIENRFRKIAHRCYMPILIVFLLYSLFPILLYDSDTSDALYSYLTSRVIPDSYYSLPMLTDSPVRESPVISLPSTFLCILIIFYSLKSIVNASTCAAIHSWTGIRIKKWWPTTVITALSIELLLLFVVDPILYTHKHKKQYNQVISKNTQLHAERSVVNQNLSLKGLSLESDMKTAYGKLQQIVSDSKPEQNDYSITLEDPREVADKFCVELGFNGVYPYEKSIDDFKGITLSGIYYTVITEFDNRKVKFEVYGHNGKVCVMAIAPYEMFFFTDFSDLIELYTKKYGEPEEILNLRGKKSEDNSRDTQRYVWQYKNGIIQLSRYDIVYVSSLYMSEVEDMYNKAKKEYLYQIDEEQQRLLREDSLRQVKRRNDSLKKLENHRNAINEI